MNNKTRAHAGQCAISAHQETKGVKADEPDTGMEDLTDLLADLMHYAQHNKLDFEAALDMAIMHFAEEE